jgi:hypothetical protein
LTFTDLKNFRPDYHVDEFNNKNLPTYERLEDGTIVLRRWSGEFDYRDPYQSGIRIITD